MKRLLKKCCGIMTAIVTVACSAIMLFACGDGKGESHKHNYAVTVVEPTCGAQGYTSHRCECGDEYRDDYVNATGSHTYKDYVCDNCGAIDPNAPFTQGLRYIEIKENDDVIGYSVANGEAGDNVYIKIPSLYNGLPVLEIADRAFSYSSYHVNMTSIEMPSSVLSIGESAFSGCTTLTDISIPSGVTSIGQYAFYGCSSLTSITIPKSVTDMGNEVFKNCRSLTIYCEIKEEDCSFRSHTDWYADFRAVIWDCNNNDKGELGHLYSVIDGIRYRFRDGEATVVAQPSNITGAVIPSRVSYNGVTYTVTGLSGSFVECYNLTSVTIPNSVTSIDNGAFHGCGSLTSLTIPKSVANIDSNEFYNCNSLTVYCQAKSAPRKWDEDWNCYGRPVVWNSKNNDKDENGYIYAVIDDLRYSLKDGIATAVGQPNNISGAITVPSNVSYMDTVYSVTGIGDRAFYNCNGVTSIEMPNNVTSIGKEAFYECTSLTSIKLSNNITKIESFTFYNCNSLMSIEIPNGVTSIGEQAFYSCYGLTMLEIPDSVTNIEEEAFFNCNGLTSINLSNNITKIENYTFCWCYRLEYIEIPNSVTSIASNVLKSCSRLKTIKFGGTTEEWQAIDKCEDWDSETGDYTVICTNGTLTKD